VVDAAGNWARDNMTVTVNDTTAPVAEAGPDQAIDEGGLVMFSGAGSTDNVGVVRYAWTVLDGAPVTLDGTSQKYRFDRPGRFLVILNVSDAAGNWGATASMSSEGHHGAGGRRRPRQVRRPGAVVAFDAAGSSDNVGIVNYSWTVPVESDVILYGRNPNRGSTNPGCSS